MADWNASGEFFLIFTSSALHCLLHTLRSPLALLHHVHSFELDFQDVITLLTHVFLLSGR